MLVSTLAHYVLIYFSMMSQTSLFPKIFLFRVPPDSPNDRGDADSAVAVTDDAGVEVALLISTASIGDIADGN